MHFLQIWILPDVVGIAPEYEEKHFEAEREARPAAPDRIAPMAQMVHVRIHQDARVYAGLFDGAERAALRVRSGPACSMCTWRAAR